MCWRNKKSVTAGSSRPTGGARLHRGDQGLHFLECIGLELVVDPTSILSVANDPGIAQNAEMEGKPRLRGIQRIRELTYAALALAEQLDDIEPRLVGQRVKELDSALGSGVNRSGHRL